MTNRDCRCPGCGSCSAALAAQKKKTGAIENGLSCGEVDDHGELEMKLMVDGETGSVWISREFWEAIAEHAGWK